MNGTAPDARARMRELATASLAAGDPVGWFERIYAEASGHAAAIPWADLVPNARLVEWLRAEPLVAGTRVLVPGCGLGDEAALLAAQGATVTAFDVSPTAVGWARARHPDAAVVWAVADLLALPEEWFEAFDVVAEVYTLQCPPRPSRETAIAALARCLAPGGCLVAIGRLGGDDGPTIEGPPWPLTRAELTGFERAGLRLATLDELLDDERPPVQRFVATFARD